jgi:hypothetical protein
MTRGKWCLVLKPESDREKDIIYLLKKLAGVSYEDQDALLEIDP